MKRYDNQACQVMQLEMVIESGILQITLYSGMYLLSPTGEALKSCLRSMQEQSQLKGGGRETMFLNKMLVKALCVLIRFLCLCGKGSFLCST